MKEELIKIAETLKFFVDNPARRCASGGTCTYSIKGLRQIITARFEAPEAKFARIADDAQGCMVGMLLDKDVAEAWDESGIISTVDDATLDKNQAGIEGEGLKIPHIIRSQNDLLVELQELHDNHGYWTAKGLSDLGRDQLKIIWDLYPDFKPVCNQVGIKL